MEWEQLIGPGSYHTAMFLFPRQSGGQNYATKTHCLKKFHGIPIDTITSKSANTAQTVVVVVSVALVVARA